MEDNRSEGGRSTDEHAPRRNGSGLERRSTFRASLRRMARFRPWESADSEEQVPGCNGQEARRGAAPDRLPVVSLYLTREDGMKSRLRRSVKGCPTKEVVCSDENLSPASRQRVDRLVRKLGPEVFETARKKQLTKRKPLETIPAETPLPNKRRCSDGCLSPLKTESMRSDNAEDESFDEGNRLVYNKRRKWYRLFHRAEESPIISSTECRECFSGKETSV